MKVFSRFAAVSLACLVLSTASHTSLAQDDTPAAKTAATATPEQVVNFMAMKLSLTADQKAKITPIVADRQQKIQTLKADTSERPMQRAKKAKALLAETDKKIKAILTPDQVTQYDAMEQQMKERAQAKRTGDTN